jgi:predicted ATPase
MIESIEFKNFKALKDTTLPLSPFTLIIGPNGSGKSTAMQSLQLMRGKISVEYSQIVSAGLRSGADQLVRIVLNWNDKYSETKTLIDWIPSQRGPRHIRSYRALNEDEMKALTKILATIRVYSFEAKAIAMPTRLQPYIELGENGSNLAIVLDQLRDQEPERFEALNEEIGRLLPEFDRILFETPNEGTRAVLLRTREGHHKIAAKDLSEGTLLALALLTLAYIPDPPPIICIEEPDRGIHPRLLRDVKDALNRLAYPESVGEKRRPVQVIATTHSPYFLDLYKDFPEQVVIANKIGQEVKFERLSDRPHYEEIIQDASLGDAWYTGIFGGVPTHP